MSYNQDLLSTQWLKKRTEIIERDKHRCRNCKATHAVLQVHHTVYITGAKAWEAPDDTLITLCAKCHKQEELFKRKITDCIFDLSYSGFTYQEIFSHLQNIPDNG